MDDTPAHALLRDALALLNDRPNYGLRHAPHETSYRLAGRIDAYFARRVGPAVSTLARARRLLGSPPWLRFDPPLASESANWLPAWVYVPCEDHDDRRRAAHETALAALPPMTRDVFLAHRDRGLDYPAIAAGFGIDAAEVEHRLASALVKLDEAVSAVEDTCGGDLHSGDGHAGSR
ncbi:sigma-70 region 4 domain-containing protein [Sphingomonas sp. CGMCC 1.13654]|uniref:Sigma-70 region 4 domain-containing protein n=1 Tax=Sphingomonas chungangi TaxID=2683589 RepID=A0A838L637_9SPHN|nr:sigma-70 region 4 domain-containing protein [Sphingomonas chungangi]MBA2934634.1 sigma-70 region 4 domain-containing protein [Sphingomonas chungangi]MVW57669.1 hypothetical protein [Sphingomonas chungangi]